MKAAALCLLALSLVAGEYKKGRARSLASARLLWLRIAAVRVRLRSAKLRSCPLSFARKRRL